MIAEIKKLAKQYPGSYKLGTSGRRKLNGSIVTFIAYTDPENTTGACYIKYMANGKEYSITSRTLDIYNIDDIKELILKDL